MLATEIKSKYNNYDDIYQNFDYEETGEAFFDGTDENFNIAHECVDRHVGRGDCIKIKYENGDTAELTYGELSRLSSQFANYLERLGISNQERVLIMMEASVEFYTCFFGSLKRGACPVPGSAMFGAEGVKNRSERGDDILLAPSDLLEHFEGDFEHTIPQSEILEQISDEDDQYTAFETNASDDAVHLYSSGSTGTPTLNTLPHGSIRLTTARAFFSNDMDEDTILFNPSPPAWGHGSFGGTIIPLMMGATAGAYNGKFDENVILEALEEFNSTHFSTVPTAMRKLLNNATPRDYDLSVDIITLGGEPVTDELVERTEAAFDAIVTTGYGATEVGPLTGTYPAFDDWEYKLGSLGKPLPGNEMAIITDDDEPLPPGEIGEIAVKRRGEWRRTGDLGMVDEDGHYWHKGRADDVIISSGYTIGPSEIEVVIRDLDIVEECGVVGVPDPERGQIPKAYVQLQTEPDDDADSEKIKKQIREHVRDNLSKHEYPKEIKFIESVPKTESGKIKRSELK